MNKFISLGLLAVSIALIPMICNKKVMGKSEIVSQKNNQVTVSDFSGFGQIQTRNGRVNINADKTYTIYSKDGKVLAENITLEELQAENPELHEMMKESIAKPTLMMDAGIGIDK
ncbi:MAG: hypothetical protein MJK14_28590 [Rivularia sp. ALOHA_DT_140]|nr:hypothetical protein [Rivularia sp. ALOHA_DT_140]